MHGMAHVASLVLLHEHHLLAVDQQHGRIGQRDTAVGRQRHLGAHVLPRLEAACAVVQLGARLHHAAFAVDEVIHVLQGRLQQLAIGTGYAHLHARLHASGQALRSIQQQPQAVRITNHRQRLFAVRADRHARAHPSLHQHAIDRRAQRQALVDALAVAICLGEGGCTRMIGLAAGEVGLGLVQFAARRHTRRMQLAGALQLLARLLQLGAATHALRLGLAELGRGDPGNQLAGLHFLARLRLDARHLPRQRRAQCTGTGLVPDHPARQLQAGAGAGGHRLAAQHVQLAAAGRKLDLAGTDLRRILGVGRRLTAAAAQQGQRQQGRQHAVSRPRAMGDGDFIGTLLQQRMWPLPSAPGQWHGRHAHRSARSRTRASCGAHPADRSGWRRRAGRPVRCPAPPCVRRRTAVLIVAAALCGGLRAGL